MIKHITLRILRWRLKASLPKINSSHYKKLFNLTYRFFIYLKPSQVWIIILALLNKTEFKSLVAIPSIFMLFSSLFSDSDSTETFDPKNKLDQSTIHAKLMANKFYEPENNWDSFFWILIFLALIRRFISLIFKILWIPFKLALIYYILKYLGFDFSYVFNLLNNLSLGVIDWFYSKIIIFFNLFNNNNNDK